MASAEKVDFIAERLPGLDKNAITKLLRSRALKIATK